MMQIEILTTVDTQDLIRLEANQSGKLRPKISIQLKKSNLTN